ncbi:MAG: WecB/TagA/CpsF family glycosyltransferase [Candidatus Omnitrophota bacterium]
MSLPNKVNICGVYIDNLSMDNAIQQIENYVLRKDSIYVVTPNVDVIVQLQKDQQFKKIYSEASLVLADGLPLLWAAKLFGRPIKEKISGSDLFIRLCEVSSIKGYKLFFLGGREGSALKAAERLKNKFPKIKISGIYCPPIGFQSDRIESEKIAKMVSDCGPDILFVGLGSPKQEKWIFEYRDKCRVPVSIMVGGTFEFAAGVVKRAPIWMQRVGLEWFWRLMMEPKRLWKRYLIDDQVFFWLVLKQRLGLLK